MSIVVLENMIAKYDSKINDSDKIIILYSCDLIIIIDDEDSRI